MREISQQGDQVRLTRFLVSRASFSSNATRTRVGALLCGMRADKGSVPGWRHHADRDRLQNPGFDIDVTVTADIAAFYRVWWAA